MYRLSAFDFDLPPELIAQEPAFERSASRLLRVARNASEDLLFTDLPRLLNPGDVLVFNDTRVLHSRLHGAKKTGGKVELLLERLIGTHEARMQLRASHPPALDATIDLPGGATATVLGRDGRFFHLRFDFGGQFVSLQAYLDRHAAVPLPPYISRVADEHDEERYQTVYARHPGAVAAPTAGLHFDRRVLQLLQERGIVLAYLTLHVGAGTFQPVESDDLRLHRMHSERFNIPVSTIGAIQQARAGGHAVIAVGTTSLRALESASVDGRIDAGASETSLFITPGFRFRTVDRLLTNFHLPRSTLLMLVSAFAGYDAIKAAYEHAIAARYRFFSYGDAMLLDRDPAATA